jgi:hypothetical protein
VAIACAHAHALRRDLARPRAAAARAVVARERTGRPLAGGARTRVFCSHLTELAFVRARAGRERRDRRIPVIEVDGRSAVHDAIGQRRAVRRRRRRGEVRSRLIDRPVRALLGRRRDARLASRRSGRATARSTSARATAARSASTSASAARRRPDVRGLAAACCKKEKESPDSKRPHDARLSNARADRGSPRTDASPSVAP